MSPKKVVAIVFGGVSTEHEVSIISAASIAENIDKSLFEPIYVAIDKKGRWFIGPGAFDLLRKKSRHDVDRTVLSIDPEKKGFISVEKGNTLTPVDVVFPALHGPMGEDGTIQGLFHLGRIPYVGCDVLASAMANDKDMTKRILAEKGMPVVPGMCIKKFIWATSKDDIIGEVEKRLTFPVFIKPATMGSSIGITKVAKAKDISGSIEEAFRFSDKVLVEKAINDPIEIEVALLGNDEPKASVPGQIIPGNEFYDFDAKYINNASELIIPARIDSNLSDKLRALAIDAFIAIEGAGLARVDFLVSGDICYVNEINTMPGFTSISMYPKLWEESGISYTELITSLIELALKRAQERASLTKTIDLKKGLDL
ncbi:MAG: D-alanine--D-alanine ligase [Deltaproteobacteria bacterium]|nr:D-alanine--D-alanine ligase [Deltaproteobacteria bacterium]